jgi:subtilisin-like proprotein convertase family protein
MRRLLSIGLMGFAIAVTLRPAEAALLTYNWNSGFNNSGVIPDGDAGGWSDTRTVSTSYSSIESVSVTLNISGGYNGDLYVYLAHGSGFSVLLNRVGRTAGDGFGYGDAGFTITLSDLAGVTTDIHSYGGNGGAPLTGTFQSDGRFVDPLAVLNTDPRNNRLDQFNDLNPNGEWSLFIADMSGGDQSTLVSWQLDITAVPEPTTVALGIFGVMAICGSVCARLRSRRKSLPGRGL